MNTPTGFITVVHEGKSFQYGIVDDHTTGFLHVGDEVTVTRHKTVWRDRTLSLMWKIEDEPTEGVHLVSDGSDPSVPVQLEDDIEGTFTVAEVGEQVAVVSDLGAFRAWEKAVFTDV